MKDASKGKHPIHIDKCCPKGQCLLMKMHPNTDVGLACDSECYLTHDDVKYSKYYGEKYRKEFKKHFGDD